MPASGWSIVSLGSIVYIIFNLSFTNVCLSLSLSVCVCVCVCMHACVCLCVFVCAVFHSPSHRNTLVLLVYFDCNCCTRVSLRQTQLPGAVLHFDWSSCVAASLSSSLLCAVLSASRTLGACVSTVSCIMCEAS